MSHLFWVKVKTLIINLVYDCLVMFCYTIRHHCRHTYNTVTTYLLPVNQVGPSTLCQSFLDVKLNSNSSFVYDGSPLSLFTRTVSLSTHSSFYMHDPWTRDYPVTSPPSSVFRLVVYFTMDLDTCQGTFTRWQRYFKQTRIYIFFVCFSIKNPI